MVEQSTLDMFTGMIVFFYLGFCYVIGKIIIWIFHDFRGN